MKKLLLALVTLMALVLASGAHAADEIKLLRSQSIVSTHYGLSMQSIRFETLVKNLAYAKEVYVRMKKPDGSWVDVALAYNRPADNGREVWSGSYADYSGYALTYQTWDLEFALRYKVSGQEYWDNNGGQNYKQAKDSGSLLVGANVLGQLYTPSSSYSSSGGVFYTSVTLKNLSPNKQVKVVYSTDGWQTTKTAWGSFNSTYWYGAYSGAANPNQYGVEEWNIQLAVGSATHVDYAIAYLVNGQTYWDNNFGQNYGLQLIPQ